MREGGEASFRATLVGLIPALRAYGRALGRSRDAADDLVQETLLAALASPQRPDTVAECRAWLFTILRHAFVSRLRAERRAGRHAAMLEPAATATAQPGGASALRELGDAMTTLSPLLREALTLMGAQGLSATEAARICGVAEGTMRARLSRGRATLREALDPATQRRGHDKTRR